MSIKTLQDGSVEIQRADGTKIVLTLTEVIGVAQRARELARKLEAKIE